ncbi:MAG: Hpt domain-containing protein [Candidatus Rokubacteria bacterium]|nr:Hpt domain-containing protein [Candidatus Rokubacteria bacterium]
MQVDAAETLRPGFLNDYVAECGEHLTAVRRALVQLESTVGGTPARAVVDELFHAFHSLKGLSGMVGSGTPKSSRTRWRASCAGSSRRPSP